MENRGLNFALMEGYHTALMKGRYPVCCLFLEIDPSAVDVNIHPAKREVKFHREREVRQLMAQAIRETLLKFHTPAQSAPVPAEIKTVPRLALETPRTRRAKTNRWRTCPICRSLAKPLTQLGPAASASTLNRFQPPGARSSSLCRSQLHSAAPASPAPRSICRLVGVIGKLYVVLESDRGLVLLDQHAAHERILFEQMLRRMEKQEAAPSQRLLLPETVELPAREAHFLREQLPTLTRLGVGLSEFGERTFLLDSLPPFVKVAEPRKFVMELVDELKAAGQSVNSLRLGEHTIAKTVCRHSVKANDPLAGPELENLVEDLRHCSMPYTCPHGRPTLIEMNFRELEKIRAGSINRMLDTDHST